MVGFPGKHQHQRIHRQVSHAGTGATTKGMTQLKALQAILKSNIAGGELFLKNMETIKLTLCIASMYGVFTFIWLIFMVNIGKYTKHGSYIWVGFQCFPSFAKNMLKTKNLETFLILSRKIGGSSIFSFAVFNGEVRKQLK